jgi:Zn-dependent protease
MAEQKGNPIVSIASVIGGISVAIVAVIAVLAKDQLSVAPWIVAALAIMGIVLGFFASKASKPQ